VLLIISPFQRVKFKIQKPLLGTLPSTPIKKFVHLLALFQHFGIEHLAMIL